MENVFVIMRHHWNEDKTDINDTWQILGIFDNYEKALDNCLGELDGIFGPLPFNLFLPDVRQVENKPKIFYPNFQGGHEVVEY